MAAWRACVCGCVQTSMREEGERVHVGMEWVIFGSSGSAHRWSRHVDILLPAAWSVWSSWCDGVCMCVLPGPTRGVY